MPTLRLFIIITVRVILVRTLHPALNFTIITSYTLPTYHFSKKLNLCRYKCANVAPENKISALEDRKRNELPFRIHAPWEAIIIRRLHFVDPE